MVGNLGNEGKENDQTFLFHGLPSNLLPYHHCPKDPLIENKSKKFYKNPTYLKIDIISQRKSKTKNKVIFIEKLAKKKNSYLK